MSSGRFGSCRRGVAANVKRTNVVAAVGRLPSIDADERRRIDAPARLPRAFRGGRADDRFAGFDVAGRLVEPQAVARLLLDQQEAAVALDDRRDRHGGTGDADVRAGLELRDRAGSVHGLRRRHAARHRDRDDSRSNSRARRKLNKAGHESPAFHVAKKTRLLRRSLHRVRRLRCVGGRRRRRRRLRLDRVVLVHRRAGRRRFFCIAFCCSAKCFFLAAFLAALASFAALASSAFIASADFIASDFMAGAAGVGGGGRRGGLRERRGRRDGKGAGDQGGKQLVHVHSYVK